MHFGLLLSAVLFLLVSIFPIQALRIFTTDSAILEQGAQYLSIIRFTYLFFAITQILLATFEAWKSSALRSGFPVWHYLSIVRLTIF